jgi:hypothetical protein
MVLDLVAIIPQDFFWKREACSALDPVAECDGLLFAARCSLLVDRRGNHIAEDEKANVACAEEAQRGAKRDYCLMAILRSESVTCFALSFAFLLSVHRVLRG